MTLTIIVALLLVYGMIVYPYLLVSDDFSVLKDGRPWCHSIIRIIYKSSLIRSSAANIIFAVTIVDSSITTTSCVCTTAQPVCTPTHTHTHTHSHTHTSTHVATTTTTLGCQNCTGICSQYNFPYTSIATVNPTAVISGTTYTSKLYTPALSLRIQS